MAYGPAFTWVRASYHRERWRERDGGSSGGYSQRLSIGPELDHTSLSLSVSSPLPLSHRLSYPLAMFSSALFTFADRLGTSCGVT